MGISLVERRALLLLLPAVVVCLGCGGPETVAMPGTPALSESGPRCEYVWSEGDGWRFISWAVMGSAGHADALALGSGFEPGTAPSPGDTIMLPLSADLETALRTRLSAARLVRRATEARETGDRVSAGSLLMQAAELDEGWSVPVCDLAILYIEDGALDAAEELLSPLSHKYRVAWLLSWVSWRRGRTEDALEHIQTALMDPSPPPEVVLAAGIIYSVTGNDYQAGLMWRRVLSDPSADTSIRLEALRRALGQRNTRDIPSSLQAP
jgi:hypothetical protein